MAPKPSGVFNEAKIKYEAAFAKAHRMVLNPSVCSQSVQNDKSGNKNRVSSIKAWKHRASEAFDNATDIGVTVSPESELTVLFKAHLAASSDTEDLNKEVAHGIREVCLGKKYAHTRTFCFDRGDRKEIWNYISICLIYVLRMCCILIYLKFIYIYRYIYSYPPIFVKT